MKEEDFDLIEASLQGRLSVGEQSALEERIQTDAAFRLDYEEIKLMIGAAHELAREKMKDEVKVPAPGKVIQWPTARILAIAATLLLIAVVAVWLSTSTGSDLFEEYYTPYQALSFDAPRGDVENYESKLRALDLYRNNKPAAAIQVVDSVLARNPDDEDAILIKALSYLDLKEFHYAIEWLRKVTSVSDAVKWYMALAQIGVGNRKEATVLLDQLIESKDYAVKAAELRKRIGNK